MTIDQETINTALALVMGLVFGTTKLRVFAWCLREVRFKEELDHPGMIGMEVLVVLTVVLVVTFTGHIKGEDWGVFGLGTALPWWIRGVFMMKKEMKTLGELTDLKEEIGQLRETLRTKGHHLTSEPSGDSSDDLVPDPVDNPVSSPP